MTTKKTTSDLARSPKTTLAKKPTSVLPARQVIDGAAVLVEIANKWMEYKQVAQQEGTKREGIRAQTKVALAQIQAKRELMMKLLDDGHLERAEVFKGLFRNLDEALGENKMDHAASVVESITNLANRSPIKVLAESDLFKAQIQNPEGGEFSF